MPFPRGRRIVRRGAPRKRAIWVNIPFSSVAYTEVAGAQLLLTPEDWEAQFTALGMEHALLRAVVGEIYLFQTVVSTTAGIPTFWGIYKESVGAAAVLPAFTVTGMGQVDWLLTGCQPNGTTVTASTIQTQHNVVVPIKIKTKRKLTSQDQIKIIAQVAADAGAPAGTINGLLRFLISRD